MLRLFITALICFISVSLKAQEQNRRSYSVVCHGITKKGTPCKSRTYCNNSLCYNHGGNCYNKTNKSNTIKEPLNNNSKELSHFVFNKFDRDIKIERIFVVANEGEDCDGKTHDGKDIALLVETILLSRYDILERKHFDQVLEEQRLAASGLLLEETAVELGYNEGSQGIIFTEVGCLSDQTTINLKLVGCQKSDMYWSCIGIGESALKTVQKVKQELSKE